MANKGNKTICQYIIIYYKNRLMAIPYGHPQQRLLAPADGLSRQRPRDPGEQHQARRVSMAAEGHADPTTTVQAPVRHL